MRRYSGKGNYIEPGWSEPVGNYTFSVYVEDRNEPGSDIDRIWIQIKDKDGNIVAYMSLPLPAEDNAQSITGGNIVAPHSKK